MSEVNDDTQVTIGMLEQWAAGFVKIVNNEVTNTIKQNNEQLLNTVSQQNAEQIDSINTRINQILSYLQQGQQPQQEQAQQQVQPARGRLDIAELTSAVREAAAAYTEIKRASSGEPGIIDQKYDTLLRNNLGLLFNRSMKAAVDVTSKLVRQEIDREIKGPLTRAIANDIVSSGAHDPVL